MSNYTITVYSDSTLTNAGFIHTWAVIRNNLTGEFTLYSFQCGNVNEMLGPTTSFFDPDSAISSLDSRVTASYTYDLSLENYNKAVEIANRMRASAMENPNAYPYSLIPNGIGNNCVTMLNDLLNEVGINDFNGIIDPVLFDKVIDILHDGVPSVVRDDLIRALIGPAPQVGDLLVYWLGQFGHSELVGEYFDMAGRIINLKDPLALDLNNDGITTISANDGIMFDHNNSGIRYGTGWINPSDGWLALDRNGNGKIDSGRELFGDNTRKLDGNFAAHAYDALKSFDTNNDGQVSAADATGDADSSGTIDGSETYWDIDNNGEYDASVDKTFADLRVWVDANSNGVTDGGELKTLAELNIVSIGTGKTTVNVADENGNLNTFKGNYTTSSGEVVDGTRSFNLLQNTFHRDWPNGPNIPPDVAALPNMQGSGAVRDLHEAMSLGTPQSLALKTTVQAFNNATTRSAQYALIDKLLMQWGRTSDFEDLAQRLENMNGGIQYAPGAHASFSYLYTLTTGEFWDDSNDITNKRNQTVDLIADVEAENDSVYGERQLRFLAA
jgi:hypothetical protein